MSTFDDLLARLSRAAPEFTQAFLDGCAGQKVPVKSWTSPRNLGLALCNLAGAAVADVAALTLGFVNGQYLESAEGPWLTKLARSQFQLERYPAVAARVALVADLSALAPRYDLSPAELVVGPPGAAGVTYANDQAVTLLPGSRTVHLFTALVTGEAGNLAAGTQVVPKTTRPGLALTASPALLVGTDPNGQLLLVTQPGAPSGLAARAISGGGTSAVVSGGVLTLTLAAGATAAQAAAAINGTPQVAALFLARALGTGAAPCALFAQQILAVPTVRPGQAEEPDGTLDPPSGLRGRCVTRWATKGYGGSEDAMIFWGLALPAGYDASPVTKVRAYSNRLANGNIAGNAFLVVIAGAAGALAPADVAAVRANYESPQKYPLGVQLAVVTTVNKTIFVSATVQYFLSSGLSASDLLAAIARRFALYTTAVPIGGFRGSLVRADRVQAQIEGASDAIDTVQMGNPAADVTLAWNESAVFDLSLVRVVGV